MDAISKTAMMMLKTRVRFPWAMKLRMARARTLLRESNLSMDEVALRFGEGPGTFRRGLRKRLEPQ